MYPFEAGSPFVSNAWYVAAWSSEIGSEPIARTVLGRSLVLYRQSDGRPVVLANRCPHRGHPLAMGRVNGDAIVCPYHGFEFEQGGRCSLIPSQERVPPGIAIAHFPAVEQWQWVWVWMGDPNAPDRTLLPDEGELGLGGAPWLAARGADFYVRARYQLFNENLLDLTHLTFLHSGTIGNRDMLETEMRIETAGRMVRVSRDTLDEQTSPFYAQRLGIPMGRIDRRHVTTFIAPSFHIISVRAAQAGTGTSDRPVVHGEHKILHAITPETATTLHDFWAITRTYNTTDEMTAFLRENINGVIRQDIVALEAAESMIDDNVPVVEYSCAADEAALKGRRLVQDLLRAERVQPKETVR
jgi:phenylpropionate dioxygenase-like ring-hydroxylating dioxygenase large terminal subunit